MSRSIKIKTASASHNVACMARASLSSSSELTDSDGYSGIEAISDDEDDEDDVKAAEEDIIVNDNNIANAKRNVAGNRAPRPAVVSDNGGERFFPGVGEKAEAEDEDDDDSGNQEDNEDGDDESSTVDESDSTAGDADAEDDGDADENASWNGFLSEVDNDNQNFQETRVATKIERKVRFADDIPYESTDEYSTETDMECVFPDLFLAPGPLMRSLSAEGEAEPDRSSNDSYWDFAEPYNHHIHRPVAATNVLMRTHPVPEPPTTPQAQQVVDASRIDSAESDGYESDFSDTTDREEDDEQVRLRSRRGEISETDMTDSEAVLQRHGEPRRGKINVSKLENTHFSLFDPVQKKLVYFSPKKTKNADQDANLNPFFEVPLDFDVGALLSSPGGAGGPDVMLSGVAMFPTYMETPSAGPAGPAEAFFSPLTKLLDPEVSSDEQLESIDEAEEQLDVSDFLIIDMGDSDIEDSTDNDNTDTDPFGPERPSIAADSEAETSTVLGHLRNNSDAVGAFRINQHNQRLILSNRATEESLAFSGPFHQGAIRGIRDGRIDGVSVPISPVRRQKRQSIDFSTSPSPLKRKASTPEPGHSHKKHRSISEVGNLEL